MESVFFNLNDGAITKTENVEPYAVFGDRNGNFNGGSLPVGDNSLTLELFSKNRRQGEYLGSITQEFTIINDL